MPYLLLVLTTLFWSGNFVLSRGMHAAIPPMALSFWRWSVALLILVVIAHRHLWAERQTLRTQGRFIVVQGLLGVLGFELGEPLSDIGSVLQLGEAPGLGGEGLAVGLRPPDGAVVQGAGEGEEAAVPVRDPPPLDLGGGRGRGLPL